MSSISAGTTSTTTLVHSGDTTGSLVFKTNDTGSGGTTAVTINTSQNVGIGTTSPSATLDIVKSTGPSVRIGPSTGTSYGYLSFSNTGGNFNIGRESSTGGSLLTGSSAYASILNSFGAYPMQFGTNGSLAMTIDSSGNTTLGSGSNIGKLTVIDNNNRSQSTAQFSIIGNGYTGHHFLDSVAYSIGQNSDARNLKMYSGSNSGTGVQLAAGGTSWGTYSDERIKTGLAPIENALTKVSMLRAVTGRYNTDEDTVSRAFLIAQDVKAVLPEAVDEERDELKTLTLKYTEVIPLLVASIKELKAINDQQAETINALTARVVALEGK